MTKLHLKRKATIPVKDRDYAPPLIGDIPGQSTYLMMHAAVAQAVVSGVAAAAAAKAISSSDPQNPIDISRRRQTKVIRREENPDDQK